jgi:hypothetical protein
MAEIVEEFGLISFSPLDISSAESVGRVLAKIDKCNGYIFTQQSASTASSKHGKKTTTTEDIFQCAIQSESSTYESIADIQERLSIGRKQSQKNRK